MGQIKGGAKGFIENQRGWNLVCFPLAKWGCSLSVCNQQIDYGRLPVITREEGGLGGSHFG
jgi:hypothetical protein